MRRSAAALCVSVVACGGTPKSEPIIISGTGKYPPQRVRSIDAPDVNGAILIKTSVSKVKIRPVEVINAYRALETAPGVEVVGLEITGLTGKDLRRDGIRLRHASDVVISRFELRHASEPSEGKHLPEGIAIVAGRNIVIRDGILDGFRMKAVKGKYTNGDGIATEGAVEDLTIERVTASNNSDGGFDLKGSNITLRDLEAVNNNRAFRIWSRTATATTLRATNFKGAAVWLGKGASITIDRLIAKSDVAAAVFRYESGARLVVRSCDLTGMPSGSKLVQPDGKATFVSLGKGCSLPD